MLNLNWEILTKNFNLLYKGTGLRMTNTYGGIA